MLRFSLVPQLIYTVNVCSLCRATTTMTGPMLSNNFISLLAAANNMRNEQNETTQVSSTSDRRPQLKSSWILFGCCVFFYCIRSEVKRQERVDRERKERKRNFEFSDSFFFGHSTFVVIFLRFWLSSSPSLFSSFAFNLLQTSVFVYQFRRHITSIHIHSIGSRESLNKRKLFNLYCMCISWHSESMHQN